MTNSAASDVTLGARPPLTCPHCHGEIPFGATVCRGCQGEVRYGAPRWAYIGSILVAVFAWASALARSPTTANVVGIATGLVLLSFVKWAFRRRIAVSRAYRT